MALVTTIGSKTANSICTVAEADSYLDDSGLYDMTAWDALSNSVKEQNLIWGAKLMNRFYWAGWPIYKNQALFAPRWFTYDEYVYWIEYDSSIAIVEDLKKAHAYLSYDVIYRKRSGGTIDPSDGIVGEQQVKSFKLFDSLDVTLATQYAIQQADGTMLAQLLRSNYWPIYILIEPYISEFTVIPAPDGPPVEDEID